MFLITEKFLDKITEINLRKKIINKCVLFSKLLLKNEMQIRKLPKGFWVRKVKNTDIFKFRLKNDDRILFTYINDERYNNSLKILFLDYCTHDKQILKANSINLDKRKITNKELEIEKNYIEDDFDDEISNNNFIAKYKNKNFNIESITSIVVDEDYIENLIKDNDENYLYYLTNEQFECLKNNSLPNIVRGAAGSGKTTISLHKLLSDDFVDKNIGYITYTEFLKDNANSFFDKFQTKRNKKRNVKFYNINKFYSEFLNIDESKISNFNHFSNVSKVLDYSKSKLLNKFDLFDIYTEYRGILKGYVGLELNQLDNLTNINFMDFNDYLNLPEDYSIFKNEEKKEVYDFCKKYDEYLQKNNIKDENELSIEIIKKLNNDEIDKFDYLIVDEIQDLSEIQIYMLSQLVKDNTQIMFCGDVHQVINPTFFNFGRLKNIYYSLGVETLTHNLKKNYRNTIQIVDVLNKIILDRQIYIGKNKYDYTEKGLVEGSKPVLCNIDENNTKKLLEEVSNKHYCAIIVSNNYEKQRLISLYPESENRIFLINEIKGLEYENIYCFNIFSSNDKDWENIYLGFGKNNNKYRYLFNLIYVAISRAKNNLFIYEDNPKNKVLESIYEFLEIQDNFSIDKLKIEKVSTNDDWTKEANRLEKMGINDKSKFAKDKSDENIENYVLKNFGDRDVFMVSPFSKKDKDGNLLFDNSDLIKNKNDEVSKLINEGFQLAKMQKSSQAVEKYKEALKLDPKNPLIYYRIGNCFSYMGVVGLEKALEYFDKALELKEDYLEVYLDRISVVNSNLMEFNLIEEIKIIEKGYKYHKNNANLCYLIGQCYLNLYKKYLSHGMEKDFLRKKAKDYYTKASRATNSIDWDVLNKRWIKDENKEMLKDIRKGARQYMELCSYKIDLINYIIMENRENMNNIPLFILPDSTDFTSKMENIDMVEFFENENDMVKDDVLNNLVSSVRNLARNAF